MRLSDITHLRLQMNFEFRKYEQKWMPRWLKPKCFCDSRVCLRCAEFWSPVAGCIPEWNWEVQEQFFPAAAWAWALATRFSFICSVASCSVSVLHDCQPDGMLCYSHHPAMLLQAVAAMWKIFALVGFNLVVASSACAAGVVSPSSASILVVCQCSCQLEESASHPTSPSKGSATSVTRHGIDKQAEKSEVISIDFLYEGTRRCFNENSYLERNSTEI